MGARILVVDDSPIVFKLIKRGLEPLGFEIVGHAENGRIGLDMYDQLKPDVVTLDVTMPVMDGLEMAKNLLEKYPDARVIMLSAMGDEELIQTATGYGVKGFHNKPVNPEGLAGQINALLGL